MINIIEMLEKTAERYPDRVAFKDPAEEITFSELENNAKLIANVFMDGSLDAVLEAGCPVAFYMENVLRR